MAFARVTSTALLAVALLALAGCAPDREAAYDNCVHEVLTNLVDTQPETVDEHPDLAMETAQDSCQRRLDADSEDFYRQYG